MQEFKQWHKYLLGYADIPQSTINRHPWLSVANSLDPARRLSAGSSFPSPPANAVSAGLTYVDTRSALQPPRGSAASTTIPSAVPRQTMASIPRTGAAPAPRAVAQPATRQAVKRLHISDSEEEFSDVEVVAPRPTPTSAPARATRGNRARVVIPAKVKIEPGAKPPKAEPQASKGPVAKKSKTVAPAPAIVDLPPFPRIPRPIIPKNDKETKILQNCLYHPLPAISKTELGNLRLNMPAMVGTVPLFPHFLYYH